MTTGPTGYQVFFLYRFSHATKGNSVRIMLCVHGQTCIEIRFQRNQDNFTQLIHKF